MKKICLAPWVHSAVNPDGKRTVCCVYRYSEKHEEFQDWWQSEHMRKLRLEMLSGKQPEACGACFENVNRGTPYYIEYDKRFPEITESEIYSVTSLDGSTIMIPKDFDYRSDLCNLKCRTCSPKYSTALRAEYIKLFPDSIRIKEKMLWDTGAELMEMIDSSTRHIYWAGGEPFMIPYHEKIIAKLVKIGKTNISMFYSTNGMYNTKQFELFRYVLSTFANAQFSLSIDGVGKAGEYIRTGFKQEKLDTLIAFIKSESKIECVQIDCTVTSVGVLYLIELLKYALNHQIVVTIKFAWTGRTSDYLNISMVRKDVLEKICNKVKNISSLWWVQNIAKTLEDKIANYNPMYITNEDWIVINKLEKERNEEGMFLALTENAEVLNLRD